MSTDERDQAKTKMTLEQAYRFIRDVKAGMSDSELMTKYRLSPRGLVINKSAVKDLIDQHRSSSQPKPRLQIDGRKVVKDVRAGLSDDEIMEKYKLSKRQLQRVYRKIIEAGIVTPMELASRLSITESQVFEALEEVKKSVYELEDPD